MHFTTCCTRILKAPKRDGLFQRNGWWWLDYYDAEGKRHRQKAAPDYDTAKKMYREKMTGIAKGDFLGIQEEGIFLRKFIEEKYWPTIKGSLSFFEERRSRSIFDQHILPRFGDFKLAKVRTEDIDRWQSERMEKASPGTVRKEMMRFKHLLKCAVKWRYIKQTPPRGCNRSQCLQGASVSHARGKVRVARSSPSRASSLYRSRLTNRRTARGSVWPTLDGHRHAKSNDVFS